MRNLYYYFGTLCIAGLMAIFYYLDQQRRTSYEKYLGSTQIIDGDTLTVVNYSVLEKSFTLSNGTEVSFEFINGK